MPRRATTKFPAPLCFSPVPPAPLTSPRRACAPLGLALGLPLIAALSASGAVLPQGAAAQTPGFTQVQSQGVYVQIEAQPTLGQAQDSARGYAARLSDVGAFDLGNGWYGIALGPYAPRDAEAVLGRLRARGEIPRDSYITSGRSFARQYFPIGVHSSDNRPLPGNLGALPADAHLFTPPLTAPLNLPETPPTGDPMLDALAADIAAGLATTLEAEAEARRREAERAQAAQLEAERREAERREAERLETERLEAARIAAERLEAERLEAARLAADSTAEDTATLPSLPPQEPQLDVAAAIAETLADVAAEAAAQGLPLPDAQIESAADGLLPDLTPPEDILRPEAGGILPDLRLPAFDGPALPQTQPEAPPVPLTPDETEAEARTSENLLTQSVKEDLQRALRWSGHYSGGIDGLFGRGTRAAMSAWQAAQNRPATGILTTAERDMLLGAYSAPLDGLDLALVSDDEAGLAVIMPTAAVRHSATEAPFVTYGPTGLVPQAQVILLSQAGDARRLAGLYEILQTLDAMPAGASGTLSASEFTLQGGDGRVKSYSHARLDAGQIKGFTLIWPAGDLRFTRLWQEMRAALQPLPGVLPTPAALDSDPASRDLATGLALTTPKAVGAGLFVDASGRIVTDLALVDSCTRIAVAGGHAATVIHRDSARGLALLAPQSALAPAATAQLGAAAGLQVAVAGFPYGAALQTPTLTFAALQGAGGLNGEAHLQRLAVTAAAGDRGGPVLDASGAVVGLFTLPAAPQGQVLPADLGLMVSAEALGASLAEAGLSLPAATGSAALPTPTLTRHASAITAQVACW